MVLLNGLVRNQEFLFDPVSVTRGQVSYSFAVVRGDSGTISVRVDLSYLSWGITMDLMSESIGRWEVNTYAGGRKLSTGFRTVAPCPYDRKDGMT